ncbi:Bud site selection protein bud4 [Kluyveromyces marxianus]|nr:Bud site selection protein bud4 [Kluyveromyces marxianus]
MAQQSDLEKSDAMDSLLKEIDQGITHTDVSDTFDITEDATHIMEELGNAPLETAWVRHTYNNPKPVVSKRLISNDGSEISVDENHHQDRNYDPDHPESEALTNVELKENMVTDIGERLSHLLDEKKNSNPNVPILKDMLTEADERAMDANSIDRNTGVDQEKLVFKIESTKPLFPSKESPSSELIEVEVAPTNTQDAQDTEIEHLGSTSKIPITPNVPINRFISDQPQVRNSSGSSIDTIEEELDTYSLDAKYQLLKATENVPQLPQLPTLSLQDFKSVSNQNINASRVFSTATTNDNYQSAREFDLVSNTEHEDLSDERSIEDLEIPDSSTLPNSNTFSLEPEYIITSRSMETVKQEDVAGKQSKDDYNGDLVTDNDMENSGNPDSGDDETIDSALDETIQPINNTSLVGIPEEQKEDGQEDSITHHPEYYYEYECETSNTSDSFVNEHVTIDLPPLPTSRGLSTMFDDDLFNDQENSNDSFNLTSACEKDDYLLIWHSQHSVSNQVSPAISANSQFSEQSKISSAPSNYSSGSFKFKSRVISNSHIHQQEAFRQVSDEYILNGLNDSKLDPLRRNTIISKRIQQELKTQHRLYPFANRVCSDETTGINSRKASNLTEDIKQEPLYEVKEQENTIKDDTGIKRDTSIVKNECPENGMSLLPTDSPKTVFSSFLDNFGRDDFEEKLAQHSKLNSEPTIFGNWNAPIDVTDEPVDIKATQQQITKLLGNKTHNNPVQIASPAQGAEVLIGHTAQGVEVQRSDSETSMETIKRSPGKHISSPFKIVQKEHLPEQPQTPSRPPKSKHLHLDAEVLENSKSTPTYKHGTSTSSCASVYLENNDFINKTRDLPDQGKLYVKLKSIKAIRLDQIKHHQAKYSVEFDNGKEVVETPWKDMPEGESIKLDQEIEINMDSPDMKLFITLRIRYTSPQCQLVEVVEKVPIKKKFNFGKTKYKLEKRFVNKKITFDDWDFKFAKDGSFARCHVDVDKRVLRKIEYECKELTFDMINEWERQFDPHAAKSYNQNNIWKLPRKPASTVCSLAADILYIPRTSPMERFPKNLKSVKKCYQKYLEQQNISKEGFLWQEGGDVDGMLKRRYMVLKGTELIAHDENSRKPETLLNLLNVVDVYVDGKTISGKQIRNFTDMVLFSDCFKLVFVNDEVINFNADSQTSKREWVDALSRVIELNKFHQPWIKRLVEKEKYKIQL